MKNIAKLVLVLVSMPLIASAGTQKYNVSVDGMTCGGCVSKVKEALAKVPGAEKVEVVLKKKTASFTVKEDRPELQAEIAKAVQEAGFTVTAINGKKFEVPAGQVPAGETKAQ